MHQQHIAQLIQKHQAATATLNHLMNCYIREFAEPLGLVQWSAVGDFPKSLQIQAQNEICLRMDMPHLLCKLATRSSIRGALNQIHLSSPIYEKQAGKPWRILPAHEVIQRLLQHMAAISGSPFNEELHAQIQNSMFNMQRFIEHQPIASINPLQLTEQSLLWGHPFHPSPKSRAGVHTDVLLKCSPEVGASFQLHWFKVASALRQELGQPCVHHAATVLTGDATLYPCHPWEVTHILESPLYKAACKAGLISHLGQLGKPVWPTSSVRTVYHPNLSHFLKFSVHVRLTNCIRKNAHYELESAVGMSALLEADFQEVEHAHLGFRMLREPSASTLKFFHPDILTTQDEIIHLEECFGILFREPIQDDDCTPHLSGSLAAWTIDGQSALGQLIAKSAQTLGRDEQSFALEWLNAYFKQLVPPVLTLLFNHGIVLEPHLQNTVLGLANHLPQQMWVRDLEGTKLLPQHWPDSRMHGLGKRAIESVHYSQEKGWNRVSYCLFVNNIAEIILHACCAYPGLEEQAWDNLSSLLTAQLESLNQPDALLALLNGAPLASKNNLKLRLLKNADKHADYTPLNHPLHTQYEHHTD
ncbi:MAG TPA: IucA/IucC family protein [Limnobacter sp.]|nr:IucA/IucC family protein [Limnobacter sp.]